MKTKKIIYHKFRCKYCNMEMKISKQEIISLVKEYGYVPCPNARHRNKVKMDGIIE